MSTVFNIYGFDFFDFSSEKYVTAAVKNVEDHLDKNNAQITSK